MNEQKLENALKEMASREDFLKTAVDEDAEAEHAYRVNKAKAFLAAEGTEKAREAQSIVNTDKELHRHLTAKACATFAKEKLKDVQTAVSARQTLVYAETRSDRTHSNSGPG